MTRPDITWQVGPIPSASSYEQLVGAEGRLAHPRQPPPTSESLVTK
jgi:hypothetical protein